MCEKGMTPDEYPSMLAPRGVDEGNRRGCEGLHDE